MTQTCKQCYASFEISESDIAFYDKISPRFNGVKYSIPLPTLCPDCRRQKRLSFRNDRHLYKNTSSFSGKEIITFFSEDKKLTIYSPDEWWSDNYDPFSYGQEFDFSKTLFEQMYDLRRKVPFMSIMLLNSQNSDYTCFSYNARNAYLSTRVGESEDIFYSHTVLQKSKQCFDCYILYTCELCYEAFYCANCYECFFVQYLKNCSECRFCYDCVGCQNCFGCVGLRNKKYYFFNQEMTKEEYQLKMKEVDLGRYENLQKYKSLFQEHLSKFPRRAVRIVNSENVTGDNIQNSKNLFSSFEIDLMEDAAYVYSSEQSKNAWDSEYDIHSEMTLEVASAASSQNTCFSFGVYDSHEVYYSLNTYNSGNCFGCVNMKKGSYCILNKQYSKEEYEILVSKIIEHMKKTGEWGEFLNPLLSPFAYNETVSFDFYPLEQKEVSGKGLVWKPVEEKEYMPATLSSIPDHIQDVSPDICQQLLKCELTGKNYKIIPQELRFYQTLNLPLPRLCPEARASERRKIKNPLKLWDRPCGKCSKVVKSSYPSSDYLRRTGAPERSEIVYCETCYLESVY